MVPAGLHQEAHRHQLQNHNKNMPILNTENFYWLPILKEEVWDALQTRNYLKAEQELEKALKTIPPPEWVNTFWIGIIKGYPFLRANLDRVEWLENISPIIAKAVLNTATGEALVNIFRNLDIYPETLKSFSDLIIEIIPGENERSKIEWIKNKRTPLYIFLIANPAQELGINLIKLFQGQLSKDILQRYKSLPIDIKNTILSYATAEDIFRAGTTNHLSDEKISSLATITGQVLMGLIHFDDVEKTIQKTLNIDGRLAVNLNQVLNEKIFAQFRNEIRDIYDPMINSIDISVIPEDKKIETTTIPLETPNENKLTKEKIILIKEGSFEMGSKEEKPLIIHEEKPAASEPAITKPMKTFSPFGFFRSKAGPEEKTAVRVRVETPEKKKEEVKRVVHYSEFRTPVAPLAGKEEFMSLDKFEKEAVAEAPIALIENAEPQEHSPEQIKPVLQAKTFFSWPHKTQKEEVNNNRTIRQPKLDGNIIDLS